MTISATVKITLYKDKVIPMHYHWPYDYWQFPWEKHRGHGEESHQHITSESERWIWPTANFRNYRSYVPTEEEREWYKACLVKKTSPFMSAEAAYNMMKILGKLKAVSEIEHEFARMARHKSHDASWQLSVLVKEHEISPTIFLLAVQHVRANHL